MVGSLIIRPCLQKESEVPGREKFLRRVAGRRGCASSVTDRPRSQLLSPLRNRYAGVQLHAWQ
jgi:hypothetical protein